VAEITIVGLGLAGVGQVTREAEAAIRGANEVLYLDTGVATGTWLRTLCPKVVSLWDACYQPDRPRLDVYHDVAARVLEAALAHPPVVFAVQGHPLTGTYAPFLVRDAAAVLGLGCDVQPGVSSMDGVMVALGLDPTAMGLQTYEATDLLLRRRPLQPDVPCFLWSVGVVETRLHTDRPSRPERFERLRLHLRRWYPGDHPVHAVFVSPHPLAPTTVKVFPLDRIGEHGDWLHHGVTVYLPPVRPRPVEDLDLVSKMDDPEHLRRITR
jgi:hypothetical protein